MRVQAFVEPTEEQKRAADRGEPMEGDDFINAGIYVLEPETIAKIPFRNCSIEREFYPQILAEGAPVYGKEGIGYWLDIGRHAQYRAATRALLSGEVKTALAPPGDKTNGYWLLSNATTHPNAQIEQGCYIAENATIEAGAVLTGYTIVGRDSIIKEDSYLEGCILGEGVKIGKGCHLTDAIIDDHCILGDYTRGDQFALAAGSHTGDYSLLERA
jgi:mannose-1-phosphate guanylyltransferase/phosphomannomutase